MGYEKTYKIKKRWATQRVPTSDITCLVSNKDDTISIFQNDVKVNKIYTIRFTTLMDSPPSTSKNIFSEVFVT